MSKHLQDRIIMIDLETIGTDPDSEIFQIGASYRCPDTGIIVASSACIAPDMSKACPDTMQWGRGQPAWLDALEMAQIDGVATVSEGFTRVMGILNKRAVKAGCKQTVVDAINEPTGTRWWANPPEFDYTILTHHLGGRNNVPWIFWQLRCLRTMKEYHDDKWSATQAVSHDAEDDARNQMRILVEILEKI